MAPLFHSFGAPYATNAGLVLATAKSDFACQGFLPKTHMHPMSSQARTIAGGAIDIGVYEYSAVMIINPHAH
jgi:hypothetical protein